MQPMLAATVEDVKQLKFPLYASPKLDGIRALVIDGVLMSRNLKPIPNHYVQRSLPLERLHGCDGELIVGKPDSKDCFRLTTSGVMSEDGEPAFTFWVFDYIPAGDVKFVDRYKGLLANMRSLAADHIKVVPHVKIADAFELHEYEDKMLQRGFEGIMLRSLKGDYKFGRSTLKEGHLMKLKRFADSEAEVLALVEQMENTNEKKMNELGKMKRSSHKAGKVGKCTLGALKVRDLKTGIEFEIGTGLDDATRQQFWNKHNSIIGKVVKYKYFPSGGKDKPRFPVYLGLRKD